MSQWEKAEGCWERRHGTRRDGKGWEAQGTREWQVLKGWEFQPSRILVVTHVPPGARRRVTGFHPAVKANRDRHTRHVEKQGLIQRYRRCLAATQRLTFIP